MIGKIKDKIDENKKDKVVYKEYIKSFCDSEKAQELFRDNEDFKEIKKEFEEKKEEYD